MVEQAKKIKTRLQSFLPILSLIVVVVFFQIASDGNLLAFRTIKSMTNDVFILLIGTAGMTFLLAQGCLDFSLGANVAFSSAMAAMASQIDPLLTLPAALLSGLTVGLINGFIHGVLKVQSFIATLAMSFVLKGLTTVILGGGSLSCPFSMLKWDSTELRIIVMVTITVIGFILFEKSRFGKECKLVGANQEFAWQCGIPVVRVKMRSFMVMGALCGLVAFFALIHSATASVSTGAGFEVKTLNAMLLGGMAITGGASSRYKSAILGALIMAVLATGMNLWGLNARVQQIVEGCVFLVAVSMTFERKNNLVIK